MNLLGGNLRKVLLLILMVFSQSRSDELKVDLINGLIVKGDFRGIKRSVVYLEHSDSLIIIDHGVIENLHLNSEVVEIEDLRSLHRPSINFNSYNGFHEINARTLNVYNTIELARSTCPEGNSGHPAMPLGTSYDGGPFESDPRRYPVLPFCLNTRPAYSARFSLGLNLSYNSMPTSMAFQSPISGQSTLDESEPMGHAELLLSYKRTALNLGVAVKNIPLRGDSLIGWRPSGGGAIYAYSAGQARTRSFEYEYLKISRLFADQEWLRLAAEMQFATLGDGLISYGISAFKSQGAFQYLLGLHFFAYGFIPMPGFWELSLSYHLPTKWFLLTEANWNSLAFRSNAIPHSAVLLGLGRQWSPHLQTIVFIQSLYRPYIENCCSRINDQRFGLQIQYVLRKD